MNFKNLILLTGFIICCSLVDYMVGDLILHSRTSLDFRGKIVSADGNTIYCTNYKNGVYVKWPARNGVCHSVDEP